ncbi:STAS domain-containing protein [Dactylosporangium sp. NPDC050688]|uniref:STAS domain-containing protein n=1 Tax=Dactylosporangium sp. NPDC050688 TaxID=3157217 RepID=UPI0033FE7557
MPAGPAATRDLVPDPDRELLCDLERGFPVSVVHATGRLSFASAPLLRRMAHKALADQPDLLLIDVSGMEAREDLALTALPTLARHAGADGIAVIVTGPDAALRHQLESMAITRTVPVATSRASAVALYERLCGPPRVALPLLPDPSATAEARRLVDDACLRWRVTDLADTAALVVTELIANGIQHARTPLSLSLSLRERHLHVSVRDGSFLLPRRTVADDELESGLGLLIVEGVAAAWGCVAVDDGKVVWATLRRTGVARRSAGPVLRRATRPEQR